MPASAPFVDLRPQFFQTGELIDIDRISVGPDSSWRDHTEEDCEQFESDCRAGKYGQTQLQLPSIVTVKKQEVLAADGLVMLNNGKKCLMVLKKLKREHEQEKARRTSPVATDASQPSPGATMDCEEESSQTFSEALIFVLENGIPKLMADYKTADPEYIMAFNAESHEVDNNRLQHTSIPDLIRVATTARNKVPGGSWEGTRDRLLNIYGVKKRTYVWRIITCASLLPLSVVEKLKVCKQVSSNWVHENPFFTASGAKSKDRMTTQCMEQALQFAEDDVAAGIPLNRDVFQKTHCRGLKKTADWLARLKKQYGQSMISSSPFARVEAFLMSRRGQVQVLRCLNSAPPIQLESASPDPERLGIAECITLVEELEKAKKAMKSASTASSGIVSGDAGGSVGSSAVEQTKDIGDASGESAPTTYSITLTDDPQDPLVPPARQQTLAAASALQRYSSVEELTKTLIQNLNPKDRVVILIDAPTSQVSVNHLLVDRAASICRALSTVTSPEDRSVIIVTGGRLSLLSAMSSKLDTVNMTPQHYTVMLKRGDTQNVRHRPSFLEVATAQKSGIPTTKSILKGKAKTSEGLRLRCVCRDCPLRPAAEREALAQKDADNATHDPNVEIDAEDRVEEGDAKDLDEEDEDVDDEENNAVAEGLGPDPLEGAKRDYTVELWQHAAGREQYKCVLTIEGETVTPKHVVSLTSTAHPGVALAAHDMKAKAYILYTRVSPHSIAHGERLQNEALFRAFYRLEAAKQGSQKRPRPSDDFTMVDLEAPVHDVPFADVTPDETLSGWRAGIDATMDAQELEDAMFELLRSYFGVALL